MTFLLKRNGEFIKINFQKTTESFMGTVVIRALLKKRLHNNFD